MDFGNAMIQSSLVAQIDVAPTNCINRTWGFHGDFHGISREIQPVRIASPGVYLERCAHARGGLRAGFRWVMGVPPKSSSHYTILVLKPKVTWGSPILRNFQVNLGVILNNWDLAFETEKQEGRNTWIYWSRVDIVLVFGRWHEFIQTLPRKYMPRRMCTNICIIHATYSIHTYKHIITYIYINTSLPTDVRYHLEFVHLE